MAWNFPQGDVVSENDQEVEELTEELVEGQTGSADTELPSVEEATYVEDHEPEQHEMGQRVDHTPEQQTAENEPFAMLKVYGKYIPVQTKDELINLAQQGVDYDNKMYKLREWREVIGVVEENKVVQEMVRRALKGEDVESFVDFDGVKQDFSDTKKFKEYLKRQVDTELSPYRQKIDELERELFFADMRSKDPKLFDTVFNLCKEVYALPEGSPNSIPAGLKKQINEDKEVFKIFYNFVRDKVVAYQTNQPQPDMPTELKPEHRQVADSIPDKQVTQQGTTLKRTVRKAPVLENGRDNSTAGNSTISDAEKIWKMPSSKFQELIRRAESGYKR
ncbi:MAG: hypothetical protein EOM40_19310 [Clostridia bacterium]|nr:hypothetical protein [Clostridia bacterium]